MVGKTRWGKLGVVPGMVDWFEAFREIRSAAIWIGDTLHGDPRRTGWNTSVRSFVSHQQQVRGLQRNAIMAILGRPHSYRGRLDRRVLTELEGLFRDTDPPLLGAVTRQYLREGEVRGLFDYTPGGEWVLHNHPQIRAMTRSTRAVTKARWVATRLDLWDLARRAVAEAEGRDPRPRRRGLPPAYRRGV